MAAPFFAYTNRELNIGTNKHYVAKLDTNYNTMKSIFYLDDFVNVDGVGVIGCVTIGGANEAMHNIATRGGVGRIGNMIMLNDAGLNTYGKSTVVYITPVSGSFDSGTGVSTTPSIKIDNKEAFYVDTTSIVLEWGDTSSSFPYSYDATSLYFTLGKDQSVEIPLLYTGYTPIVGNDVFVRVKHTNSEGTHTSNVMQFTIPVPVIYLSQSTNGYASGAIQNYNNDIDITTVYLSAYGSLPIGTIVSPSSNLIPNLSSGYWADSLRWYEIGSDFATYGDNRSRILATGTPTSLPAGDPGVGVYWVTKTFVHHIVSNYVQGCVLMDGDVKTPVSIYMNSQTGKHHTSASISAPLFSAGVNTYLYDGTVKDGVTNKWNFYVIRDGVYPSVPGNCIDGEFPPLED